MSEEQAKILREALLLQRRCFNRIIVKDKEGEYRDAALYVDAQKVIDAIVKG